MKHFAALCLFLVATVTLAQSDYPNRPVRIVVPLSPGGFADTPTRILAPHLTEQLGKQFFVENRPGAGGTIGADFVAKAPPDGYTLLVTSNTHLVSSHVYKKLQYDAVKDFTHVSGLAQGPYALVVNPQKVGVSSVRDLIAAAKAQPGKIDFASSGNGGSQHLMGELFNSLAHVQLNHVPYKGSAPAMQDLLGGQVGVSFAGIPNVIGHVKAGRLKALGVTRAERWSELPDVPTIAEAGVPGYEAILWLSISGPAGLPLPIVTRLYNEIAKALQDPEIRKSFRTNGVEPMLMAPDKLTAYMHSENEKWGKIVKETGATVN